MGAFVTPYDIANQGLQLLGVPRITNFSDSSRFAQESGFNYDKARRAELRRFVWTFATRRAILRPVSSTILNLTFPAYSSATTYAAGDIVQYNNMLYSSTVGTNLANTPGVGGFNPSWEVYYGALQADTHDTTVTYYPGDMVVSSGTVYRWINSASGKNHAPPNATYWMAPTGVTTSSLFFAGALGFDPPAGATTRTLYRLPANFMRLAPQDPKQPSTSRLGTSAGLNFNDWEIENSYLSSAATTGGLIFRFVCDAQSVSAMEDMFCMAVACRMALMLNETLTQRPDLQAEISSLYARFTDEARAVNAIEGGTTEPDIGTPQPAPQAAQPRGR